MQSLVGDRSHQQRSSVWHGATCRADSAERSARAWITGSDRCLWFVNIFDKNNFTMFLNHAPPVCECCTKRVEVSALRWVCGGWVCCMCVVDSGVPAPFSSCWFHVLVIYCVYSDYVVWMNSKPWDCHMHRCSSGFLWIVQPCFAWNCAEFHLFPHSYFWMR